MLATHLANLLDASPLGVPETLGVVDGVDDALGSGLARVGADGRAALSDLAGGFAATPLGERLAEATEKIVAGSIADEHLTALAGARSALLGAVHDALLAEFDAAAGRTRADWPAPASSLPAVAAGDSPTLLAGARSWLRELAITGWQGVDHDLVSASAQVLQAVLAAPGLRRLGVLLDGLAAELQAASPVATMDVVPARRWADLWSRAMLLCESGTASQPGAVSQSGTAGQSGAEGSGGGAGAVSGRLLPLGVDVHEHGTAVQFQVHALLEPTGGAPVQLVRTSAAVSKVDTVVGPAVWSLLRGCPVLLSCLAERRAVEITDLPLLPSGDLVWQDDRARPGEPTDPFATARVLLGEALAPAVAPLERHPVRIAEPVLLEGYAVRVDDVTGAVAVDLGGRLLTVALDRLPACGPLTHDLVIASTACLGLVRWDAGRWSLQPVAVQTAAKRKSVAVHTGDWAQGPTNAKAAKSAAAAGDAVAVLRERAGRLLRK